MAIEAPLQERFSGLIRSFKGKKILVMGDLILDRFIRGQVERISPEAPVPVVVVGREEVRLGGAGNVACNIQALGGFPILMGVISNDAEGEKFEEEMDRRGIQSAGLLWDLGRPTISKTRIIASHQQICRVDREVVLPMSMELFKKAVRFFQSHVENVDAVLVSDYGKGFINQRFLNATLSLARKLSKIVAVDPKLQDFEIYQSATILTPNKRETEFASGIHIKDERTLRQAADIILRKTKTENLLITRGDEGMSLFRSTGYFRNIPTQAKEVFDVTGAGDTVIAVLTLALCAGANPEEAAILANHAAGIVVGKLGTATVSPGELLQVLIK